MREIPFETCRQLVLLIAMTRSPIFPPLSGSNAFSARSMHEESNLKLRFTSLVADSAVLVTQHS